MSKSDVIFKPIFKGVRYQYHICSECGTKLQFEQTTWGGVNFYGCKDIKYCPNCGNPVIRFSQQPIFEQDIDWSPIKKFVDLQIDYDSKVRWLFWCEISEEERSEIKRLIPFCESAYGYYKTAIMNIKGAGMYAPSWQTIQKLKRRFGSERA